MQNKYIFPLTVASFDVGPDNRLKLSAVLRYQQEAAQRQLEALGMGWDAQLAHGMAFVTSRWRGRFVRLPAMGESVTLTTWHYARKGARFIRHYEWTDAAGELLLDGVMVFALVSTEGHRLLRGDELAALGDIPACTQAVACEPPARFSVPALSVVRQHTVGWSDTDRNGHLNNTRYADLLCDTLGERLLDGQLAAVQIHFAGETKCNETLALALAGDNPWYVQGSTARGVSFAAEVSLNDIG